jgi:hypothetical protein
MCAFREELNCTRLREKIVRPCREGDDGSESESAVSRIASRPPLPSNRSERPHWGRLALGDHDTADRCHASARRPNDCYRPETEVRGAYKADA